MVGLDRARRLVHLAANFDDEGRLITLVRSFGYDTLVIAIGSVTNDFGTPGVKEHAIALDTDKIDPDKDIKITLIEAADCVLPALPQRVSDATTRLLGQLGVETRTGARLLARFANAAGAG